MEGVMCNPEWVENMMKEKGLREKVRKFITDLRDFVVRTRQAGWGSYEIPASRGYPKIRIYHDFERKINTVAHRSSWRMPERLLARWPEVRKEKAEILAALKDLKVVEIYEYAPCGDMGPFYLEIRFYDATEFPMTPLMKTPRDKRRVSGLKGAAQ